MFVDKSLVLTIVRDAFQRDDLRARKQIQQKYHIELFNRFFVETCSNQEIVSFSYESTPEGLMELLHFLCDHLLINYGLCHDYGEWQRTYNLIHTPLPTTLNALLLAN